MQALLKKAEGWRLVDNRRDVQGTDTMRNRVKESGMGLVGLMLFGAIGSILMMAVSKSISNSFKAARKLDSSLDLSAVRRDLLQNVSCTASFTGPVPCTAGSYVPLLADNGRTVVAADGSRFGAFVVRARCVAKGLEVRAASIVDSQIANPSARDFDTANSEFFRKDEMNSSLAYGWSHPKSDLFPGGAGGGGLCSQIFNEPPDSGDQCTDPSCLPQPLVGNYTGTIVGVQKINATLRRGIEIAWRSSYNAASDTFGSFSAQQDWASCKLSASGRNIDYQWITNISCQHRICNGFFRNNSNAINLSVTGNCGPSPRNPATGELESTSCLSRYGVDVPMIGMGCMWTKEAFESGKIR